MRQLALIKNKSLSFGGTTGRRGPRPIDSKNSMHLILRSTQARGVQSFRTPENQRKIDRIISKFSTKYAVRIHLQANVGNHLHFHVKLSHLRTYKPFIRAITGAIAMAVAKTSRWCKAQRKFWDYRPFTRVVIGFRAFQKLNDYIRINQLEPHVGRADAELMVRGDPEIERLLRG